jgi:predicted dehydrogenase
MAEQRISRRSLLSASAASALLAACGTRTGGSGGDARGIGIAVVGIGILVSDQILPALAQTKNCYLAGLVSSSREKLAALGAPLGVPDNAQYTYDEFDRIADNPNIHAVYIAVPNALHAEYAVRAARAGKHVLCEKPMAVSVEQGEAMLAASNAAGKYLAVAYRVQYSPHHQAALRLSRDQTFGAIQYVRANIGFGMGADDGGWRLSRELAGGGVLLEQGVYAVQTARSLIGMNPIEVFGHEAGSDPARFAEVEESVVWTMRFPNGAIAQCGASYTMAMNKLWAGAKDGYFELEPAYGYDNLRGISTAGDIQAERANQFVAQFDDFAARIRDGVPPDQNSGEEGMKDVRIISAIYESIRVGKPIALA